MNQFEGLTSGSFKNSTRRRLPICFCLDVSGSMDAPAGFMRKRIDEMNEAFNRFISSMKENEMVADAADIAILTFGGDVKIAQNMTPISQLGRQDFQTVRFSFTPLGEVVLAAIEVLNLRKQGYKAKGMKYYQPWLVVITDGEPAGVGAEDAMNEAVTELNRLEREGKIVVFNVGIGNDVGIEQLKRLSVKRKDPIRLEVENLSDFFDFLNASSTQIVTGKDPFQDQSSVYEMNPSYGDDQGYPADGSEKKSGIPDYEEEIDISKWCL